MIKSLIGFCHLRQVKMKQFIKRLFCIHDYQTDDEWHYCHSRIYVLHTCCKCGKHIEVNIFDRFDTR